MTIRRMLICGSCATAWVSTYVSSAVVNGTLAGVRVALRAAASVAAMRTAAPGAPGRVVGPNEPAAATLMPAAEPPLAVVTVAVTGAFPVTAPWVAVTVAVA